MNILLTGGAGFIGSHTAVELLASGCDVIIADNLVNSSASVIDRIEQIAGRRPLFFQTDVSDKESMGKIFAQHSVDAVIHFAGLKAVGESVKKPLLYYRNNLDTALTLLEVMKERGCRKFIFSSSATVYGMSNQVPFTEDMPDGQCTNPYGWTKLMIERILRDAAAADPELAVVVLRYFNPIGAHPSGLMGEQPNGIPNNLMPYLCLVAAGKLPQLSVFGDDYPTHDGTGVRDYIHVVDLAKGHAAALNYAARHVGAEIINLGTGQGTSVLDLLQSFQRVNGLKIPYTMAPRRDGDIAQCYADVSKARRLLGWKAEKSLDDMCRDSWNWTKKSLVS